MVKVITDPSIYPIATTILMDDEVERFLQDEKLTYDLYKDSGSVDEWPSQIDALEEIAGRVCYMSFGKGRKTNKEYLSHIIESGHGSVLEHGSVTLLITGVSRSLTHELVRHRSGFGFSQLSQRYVSEDDVAFVVPDNISDTPDAYEIWLASMEKAQSDYRALVNILSHSHHDEASGTDLRKLVRQEARSVLPNSTETKIVVTANIRAWRHFIETRSAPGADNEIRRLAVRVYHILNSIIPNTFQDYELLADINGRGYISTKYRKV